MLELYLIGIMVVATVGVVGKEYKDQISDFIMKKIEEE